MPPRKFLFILALFFPWTAAGQPASPSGSGPLVLVLDASGSMWGKVGPEAKIVAAKRVLGEMVQGLPEGSTVGLVAYGHRRESDCEDVETLLPPGPLDKAKTKALVDKLQPKGKTPITRSLEAAFAALEGRPGPATVVLLSDGLETCGGDPCAAVRAARQKRGDLLFHVIGFDVVKEDVSSLECAAQAGGGRYLGAKDGAGLAAALAAATAPPAAQPDGALVIEARADGKLQDVAIKVVAAGSREDVTGGRTYAKPETNPRRLPLADGQFEVEVAAVGIRAAAVQRFAIEIANGAVVEKKLDFSTGELVLGATFNGALADVTWWIYPAGSKEGGTQGRTYDKAATNPAKVRLPAGKWDVELHAIGISGKPVWRKTGVEVPVGKSVALANEFRGGRLEIGAVAGQQLVDATVQISAGGKVLDSGRTYMAATTNPLRFILEPGTYTVTLLPVKPAGLAKQEIEIKIAYGQTESRTVDFKP
jgi:Ca-activated chloride channel family protein